MKKRNKLNVGLGLMVQEYICNIVKMQILYNTCKKDIVFHVHERWREGERKREWNENGNHKWKNK